MAEIPTSTVLWPGWLSRADVLRAHPEPSIQEFVALSPSARAAFVMTAERQWMHIQPWLESKGYLLRPRFLPGWQPPWPPEASSYEVNRYEESIHHDNVGCSIIMDAIRVHDGARVVLKRFELPVNGRTEVEINTILSSEPLRSNPRNPALPMLGVIYAPDQCFMVFPLGREIIDFLPQTIGEGLDFVEQTLEGIAFLHEQGIAHRDCSIANLVMDPNRMYPHGIHLDSPFRDSRGRRLRRVRTPTQVGGVKYYFIDFGESMKFGPEDNTRITVHSKASIAAPETLNTMQWPYDAFKPDIYTLGTTYKQRIVEPYRSFDALVPLLDAMTEKSPDRRITAAEALTRFRGIKATFSRTNLHQRVHRRDEEPELPVERLILDSFHFIQQAVWAIQNWKW